MMKTRMKRRVLAKISSRHGTRDLPCKFPKQIHYSELQSQQRKEEIERASISQDKKWQKSKNQGIGRLWMYPH